MIDFICFILCDRTPFYTTISNYRLITGSQGEYRILTSRTSSDSSRKFAIYTRILTT